MLFKTHLVIGLCIALFLIQHMESPFVFLIVVLAASALPDIDSGFSTFGKHWSLKPLQWLTRHRGIFHSFTLCIFLSFVLAWYVPVLALPFFLGYSIHLFADALTVEGIRPFWPFAKTSTGHIRVGGPVEDALFLIFSILSVILFALLFV